MNSRVLRFVLPATLVVTTFAVASSCGDKVEEYCADIEAIAVCDEQPDCAWNEEIGVCYNICDEIEEQSECEALDRCEWSPDDNSDTVASCHQPFT